MAHPMLAAGFIISSQCSGSQKLPLPQVGPVQQGSGLNLTVLSTGERLCLGVMACKEMVPDVEDIAAGFVDENFVLTELARKG